MPRVPAAVIVAPNASRAMTTVDLRTNITNKGMGAGCPVEVAKSQVVSLFLCALRSVCARCSVLCAFSFFCDNYRGEPSPEAATPCVTGRLICCDIIITHTNAALGLL